MDRPTFEDILDQAINELAQGQTLQAVLANYPEYEQQLKPLLSVIKPAATLPKTTIPAPKREYRFAKLQTSTKTLKNTQPTFAVRIQQLFKVALVPATAVLLFVTGTQMVAATQQSLPGDSLYRFKLAAERTRVAITTNQNDKARLEISYSQKRLAEAQTVLSKEDSSPDQQAEALANLKEQTEKTFALVPSVATTDVLNNNDPSLFRDLIAVNLQQKDLLKNLPEQEETKDIASTSLEATENQGETLATLLAAVNEQELIDLVKPQVDTTGTLTAISFIKNEVTIDNTIYTITETTEIKNGDNILDIYKLPIKSTVTVKYEQTEDGKNVAQSINIVSVAVNPVVVPTNGEVKGISTPTTTSKPGSKPNTPPTNSPTNPTQQPTPEEIQPVEPNSVTGGYIAEQPE